MKRKELVLPLTAGILLLCGCNRQPKDVLGTPMTGETAVSLPEATAEASAAPAGLEEAGLEVLDYDEIRAIRRDTAPYFEQIDGYYTMSRDGLWGLMRSDGTEVLACQFSAPVTACAQEGVFWHTLQDTPDQATMDTLNTQLQDTGDGALCNGAHDGSSYRFFYNTESAAVQMDGGLFGGGIRDLNDTDSAYGAYLPCFRGVYVDGQGDPSYYEATDPVAVVYANAAGELLNDQTYEAAGCFYDQPLAPACQNGKWLYLDQTGAAVTEAVYDATYGDETASYASPLVNGYAAVCRDGQWGLLDATGAELVPCTYAGAAWDGGLLWLKQEDGWHAWTLPGVVKPTPIPSPTPLTDLPEEITAPSRTNGESEQAQYNTTPDGNLALRTGPGTEYDQVGSIPPSTSLESLGRSDQADNWILVNYEGQFGWACTDYMS